MTTPAATPAPAPLSLTTDADFPELFHEADEGAKRNQRWHFFFVRSELIFVSLAAVTQVLGRQYAPQIIQLLQLDIGPIDIAGHHFSSSDTTNLVASHALSAVFMLLTIAAFASRFWFHNKKRWHGQRALAEATKGLAWRYSMRAMHDDLSAPTPLNDDDSRRIFLSELHKQQEQGVNLHLGPAQSGKAEITANMEALRKATQPIQQHAYVTERLLNQQVWYAGKSATFESRTKGLQWARGIAYVVGFVLLFITGFGANGFAVATTIAGVFATWLVGKHYDDLSQSYAVMSRKLTQLNDSLATPSPANQGGDAKSATDWAAFVDEVETLLDGEHQEWLRDLRRKDGVA